METFNLIKGQFTPAEASDLLLDMIANKINFNKLKNLSAQVSFEKPDAEAVERIRDLEAARNQLLAMVQEARQEQKGLLIEAKVRIVLEGKEQVLELCSEAENY